MNPVWEYLEREDVLVIHRHLVATYGGMDGLRDESLFDAALEQPKQTFDGVDLYPTAAEKAARYAFGIVKNYPFADGNKRTGTACIGMFLKLNGLRFKPRRDELLNTVIAVADGTMDYEELVAWIERQLPKS